MFTANNLQDVYSFASITRVTSKEVQTTWNETMIGKKAAPEAAPPRWQYPKASRRLAESSHTPGAREGSGTSRR